MADNGKTPDIRAALHDILGDKIGKAAFSEHATPADVSNALAQAAAAVADAHAERDHWRAAYGIVQTEMVMLASVILASRGKDGKLTVSAEAFKRLSPNMQLHVGNPEPGVRVYEMRKMAKKSDAKVVLQ